MQVWWLSCAHYITFSLGWIPVIFDIVCKMEKRMPRQRATSPTIYSELGKWDLTIWCFHEYVLICFRCFRRIRSNTVILVLHIPLGTGTVVRLVSLVAQVCEFLFLQTRLHSSKDTKKPESSFLELSDFFTGDTYRASRDTFWTTVPVTMVTSTLREVRAQLGKYNLACSCFLRHLFLWLLL